MGCVIDKTRQVTEQLLAKLDREDSRELYESLEYMLELHEAKDVQRATIQQLEAQLNDKDTVPRSRYDACNKDWLDALTELDRVRAVAKTEIERLEARLAESGKAAYDIAETIQHQKQTITQLEAQVKALESELKAWHNGNGGIVKPPLDPAPDSC